MKIRITRTVGLHSSNVKNVLDLLMPHTGPFHFIEERLPVMFRDDNFEWDDLFILCTTHRTENTFKAH